MSKKRVFYIDVVRCCACFLVVASHVFAPICAGMNTYSTRTWWLFNLLDSVIRPSAALYIMISGKIFLGSSRDESYFSFVWKRYSRLFLPFFVWSMIYSYQSWDSPQSFAPLQAIVKFVQGPTAYHLWFMYLILGLYLVMPVLRRFVRSATSGDLACLLAVWMGFLIFQALVPGYSGTGPATTLLSYGGYAVLGYALDKVENWHKKFDWWALLWMGIVLVNAAGTYLLTVENNGVLNEKLYYGAAPLVAIQAAAMFFLLKNVDEDSVLFTTPWLRRIMSRFSTHSYNIYLNHALFIWVFSQGVLGFTLSEHTGPNALVGVSLTTAAVLAASLGASLFLQRIPFLSNVFVISPVQPHPVAPPSVTRLQSPAIVLSQPVSVD